MWRLITWPTRMSRVGSGVTTTRSPGPNIGLMLPESTVSVRYQPVWGKSPSRISTRTANASPARTRYSTVVRNAGRRSAAWASLRLLLALRARTRDPRLLVGRGALRAVEGVADGGRLVLKHVAGSARERERDAQMVGRTGGQRAEAQEWQAASDHRVRGENARGRAAARVRVGRAGFRPGDRALVDHHLQAVRDVGVEQRAGRRRGRQRDRG